MRNKDNTAIRPITLLLLVCMIATLLFSSSFIVSHADHECTGIECTICAQIQNATKILKQMGMGISSIAIASLICANYHIRQIHLNLSRPIITPVQLKVRLNN